MFSRFSLFGNDPFFEIDRYFNEMDRYMTQRMNSFFEPLEARLTLEHEPQNEPNGTTDRVQKEPGKEVATPTSASRGLMYPRFARGLNSFKMDVSETPEEYIIHAELPGTKKEDINVQLTNDVLTISAERNDTLEQKDATHHVIERSFGKVQRSLKVPQNADLSNTQAKYENGVLTLKLGKVAEVILSM
ncbi:HSP20-like chaperone [Paraphysoderma sedebokerense]|nr:HSP20-like chaperone [Paraphysoderma sedebokerense]